MMSLINIYKYIEKNKLVDNKYLNKEKYTSLKFIFKDISDKNNNLQDLENIRSIFDHNKLKNKYIAVFEIIKMFVEFR